MKEKMMIFGVCGVAFLLIFGIVFIIIKSTNDHRKRKRYEAAYHMLLDGYIKEFQAAHSFLNFEISYRVLSYECEKESVLYYITGDDALKEYFASKTKEFYGGFSLLVEYSVLEHIVVYLNGARWLEVDDWRKEQARTQE